jgi:hypothetical protein
MGSPLDYISTEGFRKKLITRNLVPYAKSPNPATPPITYEITQSDLAVVDSPDSLIDTPIFANSKMYPLNKWGSDGGYKQAPDISGNLNTISNQGEYGPGQQDAHLIDEASTARLKGIGNIPAWQPLNAYGNGGLQQLDAGQLITDPDYITQNNKRTLYNNQPYPAGAVNSSYSPVSILLNPDPQGNNGLLSQDSFIAQLGAKQLKKDFEDRIGREIIRNTIGRANILNINGATNLANILTGTVPLIEPNYTITVPSNPIVAATDFALRLAGSILPISEIPGSYWDPTINPPQPTTIQQALLGNPLSAVASFTNKLLGAGKTGSQIFFNNTGAGQKSILFKNINYNRYKPSYDRTFLDRLGGAIVGTNTNNANYYIGSTSAEPSRVFSPSGALPVDSFGNEQQSPVYGPSELAQLYEGPSKDIKLGANGPTYSDGGGIEGGFTWVSPKYKGNAGKKVGIGGLIANQDQDFRPSSYNSTESTNRTFKQGSILDDTQRIIQSQPQGGKRLQHVGNAIDQVSKVFNDGYKELTKGSRVLTYVGAIGQEVGSEYCRVFAKDIPYLQYNDLQKTDGIVTENRRFSWSVLDKTYNLNIAPNKQEGGQDSSNLIGTYNNAYAKKYMFSLENLAWATSNTPGFAVSDLPVCERGPNGGRVMWFPPYGLTFSETVSANWQGNDFIGRPEPIWIYKNTSRDGSLSWKIVVDHPSVLNVIVNKVLGNETNKVRIDSILESFFAGCRKYDLYELAKKYYMISPNDLFQIQQAITSKTLPKEQLQFAVNTVSNTPQAASTPGSAGGGPKNPFTKYNQLGFYFGNDFPKPGTAPNYTEEYNRYTSATNKALYASKSNGTQLTNFFDTVVTANYQISNQLVTEIDKQLQNSKEGVITITINSSCSAPATKAYNVELSKRRIASAAKFFNENPTLKKWITGTPKRLIIKEGTPSGEVSTSTPQVSKTATAPYSIDALSPGTPITCSDGDANVAGGDTQAGSKDIFTTSAMACRRAYFTIDANLSVPEQQPSQKSAAAGATDTTTVTQKTVTTQQTTTTTETNLVPRDNISKRIVRSLLSECDYFETIKEDTPMVFDNLRDKLKFFQPAFHSITPEGLNSRLTFLQQCMRPGDTIPTIKTTNGKNTLDYDNATNTAFGAPPVLILRIGDFYNTKIIPTNLAITYENLDINPEGIGVQPMIANVTMSFHFVGGSGLKESVDKLQNALTFNFYANTEIYDERADATDLSYKVIDEDFLKSALSNVPPPTVNDAAANNGQGNDTTIGKIETNNITEAGQTGTISYGIFVDKVVKETQTYFKTVVNKNRETVNQYNNALRQQWMLVRNYTDGKFDVSENTQTKLFGKPYNIEKRIDQIFEKLVSDINSGDDGFIKYMSNDTFQFSNRSLRQIKENYSNYVKNKKSTYQNAVTTITQSVVNLQQSYVRTLARVNTITYPYVAGRGTDGLQQKNGKVVTFLTSGTSEVNSSSTGASDTLTEMINDIKKIKTKIDEFNEVTQKTTKFTFNSKEYEGILIFDSPYDKQIPTDKVFIPFSKKTEFENDSFRRTYMIMSDDITDNNKYQTFKTAILGTIINNKGLIGSGKDDFGQVFDSYWRDKVKPLFVEENDITKGFIDYMEKEKLPTFNTYTQTSKKRVLTFTTENANGPGQITLIKSLAATSNQNTNNKTWNDELSNNVYVSKVKFN